MSSEENIKVGVRVRPLSSKELGEGDSECLSASDSSIECGDDHTFTFDYAFEPSTTNEMLYNSAARPLLDDVLKGFNATIMAYGQTGSGKTFTMGTDAEAGSTTGSALGVLPRFVNDMFARISEDKTRIVTISCSLLEIYNDQMRDLLASKDSDTELKLDTGKKGQVNVVGLNRRPVACTADVLQVLGEGLSERVVGATNMNAVSSRSHAIFELVFDSKPANAAATDDEVDDAGAAFCSKITFVDLAGSERLKRTGAEGGRKDEGIAINKSLLVLGTVINSLCKGLAHVPYRECKLTRLLQNALGGNSRTLFLACVSPASNNMAESLNSLRYANRAREIKNSAVVNMDEHSRLVMHFKAREEALKDQLIRERYFGGKDLAASDPEFVQQKAMPTTSDYISSVFTKAGLTASGNFARPAGKSAGSMEGTMTSSGPRGSGYGASSSASFRSGVSKSVRSAPAQARRFSEATKGKIDVAADLPVVALSGDRRSSGSSADELGEAAILASEDALQQAADERDDELAERDEEIEQVADDLELKSEILQQMSEKMKSYAERYNRLRDEFEVLNQTVATNDEEKHRLEQQIAKAKQMQHANNMSKNNPNIAMMKQKLAALNSTLKQTKTAISQKQREINSLKREKEVAAQLQRTVEKLKARKVQLERARKESEQRHSQIMAEKNRKIARAQKEVSKMTMAKRKADSKVQQTCSSLHRQQERNIKLKNDLADLKRKLNQVVAGNAARATRGGRRKISRKRDIEGEGCHKKGSKMQTSLLRYVKARVRLSQKAVELQELIIDRQKMLLEQATINETGVIADMDAIMMRLERNRNAIVIGNTELEHLQSKCGPKWTMLDSLNSMQRGSVVSYLIDEIISTTADFTNAEKACTMLSQKLADAKKETSKFKTANKTLKARAAMLQAQARSGVTAAHAALKRATGTLEAGPEDSPRKRMRAKSDQEANKDKENNSTTANKNGGDTRGKKQLGAIESVADDEFGDDEFCSGASALDMIDITSDVAPSNVHNPTVSNITGDDRERFQRALKAERALKKAAKDELQAKEARRRLTLSGMQAGGLSNAERSKQGNDFLKQGNRRAKPTDARRMTVGGRINGMRGSWAGRRGSRTGTGAQRNRTSASGTTTTAGTKRRASGAIN